MNVLILIPLLVQAAAMVVDEAYFHRKRGLGAWERVGHPIDTLAFAVCCAIALAAAHRGQTSGLQWAYLAACVFSCAIITKDEPVHSELCGAAESWLHSVLFILHPICLFIIWRLAAEGIAYAVFAVFGSVVTFMLYQAIYWNSIYARSADQ